MALYKYCSYTFPLLLVSIADVFVCVCVCLQSAGVAILVLNASFAVIVWDHRIVTG